MINRLITADHDDFDRGSRDRGFVLLQFIADLKPLSCAKSAAETFRLMLSMQPCYLRR